MSKKSAYIKNEMQLQNHSLHFNQENKSLLSGTSILSRSPMSYNTTASLYEFTCTNYVDFGNCQDRFGRLSCSKNDSNYLDIKLQVFKEDDSKEFRLVQNLTTGEEDFWPVYAIEESTSHFARNFW